MPGAVRGSRLSTVRGGRWLAVAGVAAVIAAVGTALSGVLPSRTADPVEARPGADRAPLAPAAQPTSGVPILPSSPPAPGSTRPTSARPSSPAARVAEGTPVAPAPGVSPSAVAPVATLPGPAVLGAAYRTINPGVLGLAAFRGGITVRNSGGTRAGEWTVTVTMPAPPSAATVPFVKNGTTYTFSGGPLAPGEAVEFTYDVLLNLSLKDPSPTACSIGDAGCEGV